MFVPRSVGRRTVLRAGAVAGSGAALTALTGCTAGAGQSAAGSPDSVASTTATATDDPDVGLLTDAIDTEAVLLALCVRIGRVHDLAGSLAPIAARQRAHVRRLKSSLTEAPDVPVPVHVRVPRARKAALVRLRHEISSLEQARLSDCLEATSGLLARLMASVSASHAATLEAVRRMP